MAFIHSHPIANILFKVFNISYPVSLFMQGVVDGAPGHEVEEGDGLDWTFFHFQQSPSHDKLVYP